MGSFLSFLETQASSRRTFYFAMLAVVLLLCALPVSHGESCLTYSAYEDLEFSKTVRYVGTGTESTWPGHESIQWAGRLEITNNNAAMMTVEISVGDEVIK